MEEKIYLKGFKNLVTVDDFKNELSLVDILIEQASMNKKQLKKYKNKLQTKLNKFFNFKEQSL